MDERLAVQYKWNEVKSSLTRLDQGDRTATPLNLCVYAVLLAQEDSDNVADDPFNRLINIHLARVLYLPFGQAWLPEIARGDYSGIVSLLNQKLPPWGKRRIAVQIGDQLLFLSSQGLHTGSTAHTALSLEAMNGYAQQAYMVASNARLWPSDYREELFTCLARDFPKHQAVLGLAGRILGFASGIDQFILSLHPSVTPHDLLAAICAFREAPTLDHWQHLSDVYGELRKLDDNFHYELPPRPEA